MPGDLLRFIGGPPDPSGWWLLLCLLSFVLAVGWIAAVLVWTLPPQRLQRIPGARKLHRTLVRRRFVTSIRRTSQQYRDMAYTPAQASAAYGRTVRSFLFVWTGIRAQYLQRVELANGELARAVPLLDLFHDVQFNDESGMDVLSLGRSAEELIRSWT